MRTLYELVSEMKKQLGLKTSLSLHSAVEEALATLQLGVQGTIMEKAIAISNEIGVSLSV